MENIENQNLAEGSGSTGGSTPNSTAHSTGDSTKPVKRKITRRRFTAEEVRLMLQKRIQNLVIHNYRILNSPVSSPKMKAFCERKIRTHFPNCKPYAVYQKVTAMKRGKVKSIIYIQ